MLAFISYELGRGFASFPHNEVSLARLGYLRTFPADQTVFYQHPMYKSTRPSYMTIAATVISTGP